MGISPCGVPGRPTHPDCTPTRPRLDREQVLSAGGEISWPKPARPGNVLHVETEVVSVTPSASRPDRGRVVVRSQTLNQHGEVLQQSVYNLVVPRRPA
jgi:acyl dehydratase